MKLAIVILLLFFSNYGQAACGYSLNAPTLSFTVSDINPRTSNNLTLSRNNSGGSSCNNFIMGFSKGGGNSYTRLATNSTNGSTISYNLYQNSSTSTPLKTILDATSNSELLSGTIGKNSNKTANYFFELGTLSNTFLTRGGVYTDTIAIQTNSGTLSSNNGLEISNSLSINILVPKSASLSLVDTGASFNSGGTSKTLDFGELTTNEEMSFDIILLSNAGYTLSVSSSNNQVLQLSGVTQSSATQIGYNFYTNSVLKNLLSSSSNPVILSTGSGVTSVQGARVPIKIVIQSVDNKVAGVYQDYLTFTIATTE